MASDRKKEIHKIDNHLIRFGWIALVVALLMVRADPEPAFWIALSAGVVMLAVGYVVRHKEKRVVTVWNILEHATEVSMAELTASTGLSRPFVHEAIAVINAQPGAYYVWNRATDTVVDGRLRARVVMFETCGSCGARVAERLTLDASEVPICEYCGRPVSSEDIGRLKLDALRALREEDRARGKGFSTVLFIVLLIVFWPAAVGYALWKSGIVQGLGARASQGRGP